MSELAWIIIVNLALYFRTLRFKFVSDDFTVYHNPPKYKNWLHKRWLQITGQGKWSSKAINFFKDEKGKWKIAVLNTGEQEHLLALLIHISLCVTIYYAFGANQISFLAALLYGVNPVNNQATIWPAGRSYALSIIFLLMPFIFPYGGPLFLFCAAWYTAGFLPPIALIGSKIWYLLAFMPFIWWWWGKRKWVKAIKYKQATESFVEDRVIHPRKLILFTKTFGFYLTLAIFPTRITFYHNFLQSAAGSMKYKSYTLDRYFWIGLSAFCAWGWFFWAHGWNELAWSFFAFFITIAPFCNFVRSTQEIAERFLALPNVFLMYALCQIIGSSPIVVTAFLIFYVTRTYYTLVMYKDEYFITELAIIEDPHAWWAWHCRAMKRWDTQSFKEALILWVMAKLISPNEFKILMNIASCLRILGNNAEADAYLALAERNIVEGQEKQAMEFIKAHREGKLPILL